MTAESLFQSYAVDAEGTMVISANELLVMVEKYLRFDSPDHPKVRVTESEKARVKAQLLSMGIKPARIRLEDFVRLLVDPDPWPADGEALFGRND